jgi:hypothetical protein
MMGAEHLGVDLAPEAFDGFAEPGAILDRLSNLRTRGVLTSATLVAAAAAYVRLDSDPQKHFILLREAFELDGCRLESGIADLLGEATHNYLEMLLQQGRIEEIAVCIRHPTVEVLRHRVDIQRIAITVDLWLGQIETARNELTSLSQQKLVAHSAMHRTAALAASLENGPYANRLYQQLLRDNLDRIDLLDEFLQLNAATNTASRSHGIVSPKHNFCIAICIKNEGENILEWMAYHRLLGAEHFYIYLNDCSDDTEEQIAKFPERQLVTLNYVPGDLGQSRAYRHFISNYKTVSEWCAFIDADEFLVPTEHDDIREVINMPRFNAASGIAVHWLNFGSNGHETKPSVPTIAAFTLRAKDSFPDHFVIKGINRMDRVISYIHPHQNKLFGTYFQEDGEAVFPILGRLSTAKHSLLRLHHYYTRSRQQMLAKRARGRPLRADDPARLRDLSFFSLRDTNDVHDGAAARFLPALMDYLGRAG